MLVRVSVGLIWWLPAVKVPVRVIDGVVLGVAVPVAALSWLSAAGGLMPLTTASQWRRWCSLPSLCLLLFPLQVAVAMKVAEAVAVALGDDGRQRRRRTPG